MAYRGAFFLNGIEISNTARLVAHLGQTVPTSDVGVLVRDDDAAQLWEDPPGSDLWSGYVRETSPGLYSPEDLTGGDGLYTPVAPPAGVGDEDPADSGLFTIPSYVAEVTPEGFYSTEGFTEWFDGLFYNVDPNQASGCLLTAAFDRLYEMPETAGRVGNLWSPPDGSRRYSRGILQAGPCWSEVPTLGCGPRVVRDDSWTGQREWLKDTIYRPELAPWYSIRYPASAEFAGVWVTDVKGLDATPTARKVSELVGSGGVAGPHRDIPRKVTFEALLIASSNAGLEHGLKWLTCQIRDTADKEDSVLRYFAAHPQHTRATPSSLVRELHGVVMTQEPQVQEPRGTRGPNEQATVYKVRWELTAASPYAYMPTVEMQLDWDSITYNPTNWMHGADCESPDNCVDMPVLFSATCVPEVIEVVSSPPPVCGGCMPVCGVEQFVARVPTLRDPVNCRETAVSVDVINNSLDPLTLQCYWRVCGTDIRCEDERWPFQIAGLPGKATLTMDAISGQYWATLGGKVHRPRGILGTKTGAPWRPVILDRSGCWEFVAVAGGGTDFDVKLRLTDREP